MDDTVRAGSANMTADWCTWAATAWTSRSNWTRTTPCRCTGL